MKAILVTMVTLLSFNALAISFITEAEVRQALGVDNVIEVSKYSILPLIQESDCKYAVSSKSARAYIVKKGYEASIVVTASGLESLQVCVKL